MKKALKKSIIWGSATLGLSGLVAGITVPIVLKSNQTTYVRRFSINENDFIYDEVTLKNLNKRSEIIKEKEEIAIGKIVEKAYQEAYKEEEEASIEMQNKFLKFEKYKIAFDLIFEKKSNEIPEINESQYSSWEALENFLKTKQINAEKIDQIKNEYKEINNLQSKINSRQTVEMPTKYSNPWKLLRPFEKFKEEAKKEYDNKKEIFVNRSKTKEEGEAKWNEKGMAETFNGASSAEEAKDKLVVMMIKEMVDQAMEIQFISSFTWKHFESGIFEDILGSKGSENNSVLFKAKDKNASVNNLNEKLHFLGTKSNIISKINLFKNQENIIAKNIDKIAKERSFSVGGKMKDGLSYESWTIDKENLKKMIKFINIKGGTDSIDKKDIINEKYCISYNLFKNLFNENKDSLKLSKQKKEDIEFFQRNIRKIGSGYEVESGYKSIEKDLKNSASKSVQGAKIQILKDKQNQDSSSNVWEAKQNKNFIEELGKEIIKNIRYEKSISSYISNEIFEGIYVNKNNPEELNGYKHNFWNDTKVSFTNLDNWNKMIEKFIDHLDQEDVDKIFTTSILDAIKTTYGNTKNKMFLAAKEHSSGVKNKYIFYDSSTGLKINEYINFNNLNQQELKDKIIVLIKEELEYKINNNENTMKTDWLSILKATETEKLMKLLKIPYEDNLDADDWETNNNSIFQGIEKEEMLDAFNKIVSNYNAANSIKITQILEKGYNDWIINAIDNNQFDEKWYDEEIKATIKGVI